MDTGYPFRAGVYVIMVSDYVVLTDLEDTVRDYDPFAAIHGVTSLHAAIGRIQSQRRLDVVFLETGQKQVRLHDLDQAVRDRGGQIILLGGEAEDDWITQGRVSDRWPTLLRPFSSQMVLSLLIASHR